MEIKKLNQFEFDGEVYKTEAEAIVAKIMWTIGVSGLPLDTRDMSNIQEALTTNSADLATLFNRLSGPAKRSA